MSVIVNPPSSSSSISVTTPSLASGISITNPNPANSVIVSPPDGGNLVTIYAGVAGPVGPQGPSNTLDVLSTTTGNPGTSANVAISGTSPNQHLAFTVPAGVSPTLSVASTVNTVVSGNNGSASLNNANPLSPTLSLTLPAGPTGPANTLSVGGTTTGSAGTNAIASLSGSSPNQSLYFTIPAGVKGDTGATGGTGATGPANTLSVGGTTTGTAGTNAIASLSGTAPNQSLYFTIPAGVKGDTGASPTLSVNSTVATVPSGSQGSATLSGTATNPVLSLTLPAGQAGSTGATGAKGDTGNTGSTGATPTLSVNSTVATLGYGNNGSASIGGTLPNNPRLYLTLPAGPTGPAGSDASVTSANISSALGYTPIGDAPNDGYQYARKSLDWVEITTGNPFDQSLNTSDNVVFNSVSLYGGSASIDSLGNYGDANAVINVGNGPSAYGIQGLLIQEKNYDICDFGLQTNTGKTYSARLEGRSQYCHGNNSMELQFSYIPDAYSAIPRLLVGDSLIAIGGNGETIKLSSDAVQVNNDGSTSFANGAASIDGSGKVYLSGSGSNDSVLKVGPLEFQPYAVNNVWFGDNAYYNSGNR